MPSSGSPVSVGRPLNDLPNIRGAHVICMHVRARGSNQLHSIGRLAVLPLSLLAHVCPQLVRAVVLAVACDTRNQNDLS